MFEPNENLLVACDYMRDAEIYVKAVELSTGEALWQITQDDVGGALFYIQAMCNDGYGNILMANFSGKCINIVDAKTGRNIRKELEGEVSLPTAVSWLSNPQKVAIQDNNGFCFCDVEYE